MSGAKENQAVRSEASYLIFRPASVAKACEAHEALTFWLLLGQAKSDKKIMSGFQPSQRGMGIDTPSLRDGAEIYRAFSPFGQLTIEKQP